MTEELQLARSLLRRPTRGARAYRTPIELASNATRMASMRRNRKRLLRIFSGVFLLAHKIFAHAATRGFGRTVLRRGFTRKSFENAVELRKRLKPRGERDFTDAQIAISQQITRSVEPGACNILDKINAGYLLKIFAQMIRVHVNHLRDFGQGKLFACVFFDVLARFPNRDRLGSTPTSRIFNLGNEQHLCHRLMVNRR